MTWGGKPTGFVKPLLDKHKVAILARPCRRPVEYQVHGEFGEGISQHFPVLCVNPEELAVLATFLWPLRGAAQPIAQTAQATYKGVRINSAVDGFLGIPYAEPPLVPLRFAPPQPVRRNDSKSIVQATEFEPVCHQFHYKTVREDNLVETSGQSEDCLTLNIFVPRQRCGKKLLPVYVWSFGGRLAKAVVAFPVSESLNLFARVLRVHLADITALNIRVQPHGLRGKQQGHHRGYLEVSHPIPLLRNHQT